MTTSSSENPEQLDALAEEFSHALRAGERPRVEAFVDRCDSREQAEELRELLSNIQLLEELKQPTQIAADLPADLDGLDDYTLVREVGRGGMGIVYEAVHRSLGRRVAIKVLAGTKLDEPKRLARFRVEARAAARLRHPHIVPVFGIGNHDSVHYYVMDYIRGLSLREILNSRSDVPTGSAPATGATLATSDGQYSLGTTTQRPPAATVVDTLASPSEKKSSPTETESFRVELAITQSAYQRWAAEIARDLSDALTYSHAQNVLHRDIKPANILIDEAGQCWLADFGLAKLADNEALTQTGDLLGTPQYMPPESFRGEYDQRSEIYAVGLTLYEMLTLQAAVQGSSSAEVLRRAAEPSILPVGKRNFSLPKDLATIVDKCLAVQPGHRYATAAELKDDLNCFLARRPIKARRNGPLRRLVLWGRREPLVAGLTVASFMLLASLVVVTAAGLASTRRALGERTDALSEADEQRRRAQEESARATAQSERAEANLRVALEAFQEIMNNVSSRSIESDADILGEVTDTTIADVSAADAAMLESLLKFFDELAKNNSSQLIEETSQAARHAGDIYVSLGELREASEAYRSAVERLDQVEAPEGRFGITLERVRLLNQLAMVDSLRGKIDEATVAFEQAVATLDEYPELKQTAEGQFQAARAHRLYASLASRSGLDSFAQRRPGPAGRELAGRKLADRELAGRAFAPGNNEASKNNKPFSRLQLRRLAGQSLGHLRSRQDAENAEVAIDILTELLEAEPANVRYLAELAHAYRNLAEVEFRQRRRVDADRALRQSVAKWEEILKSEPENEAAQFGLASTLASANALGFNQLFRANRAHELTMQLVRKNPSQPRYRALRARSLENLAKAELRAGKDSPAMRHAGEAVKLYRQLAEQTPEVASYAIRQAGCLDIQAEIAIADGSSGTAKDLILAAIEAVDRALESNPQSEVCRLEKLRLTRRLQGLADN